MSDFAPITAIDASTAPVNVALRKGQAGVRARTLRIRQLSQDELALRVLADAVLAEHERPRTRADCVGAPRPCPWVACRHHTYLDVNPATGSIKLNFPATEIWDVKETCSLDVADRGGATLEEVGDIMNVTRERARQLEVRGLLQLKQAGAQDFG